MKANPPSECLLAGEAPGCRRLGESQRLLLVPGPPPRGLADSWENKIKIPAPPLFGAALYSAWLRASNPPWCLFPRCLAVPGGLRLARPSSHPWPYSHEHPPEKPFSLTRPPRASLGKARSHGTTRTTSLRPSSLPFFGICRGHPRPAPLWMSFWRLGIAPAPSRQRGTPKESEPP